jgi:hypothetical protein
LRNTALAAASALLVALTISSCKKAPDSSEFADNEAAESVESAAPAGSPAVRFEGNSLVQKYQECKASPYTQECPAWVVHNDLPQNALFRPTRDCANFEDGIGHSRDQGWESKCVADFLNLSLKSNVVYIHVPSMRRFDDSFSILMIRGNTILPINKSLGTDYIPVWTRELAWIDCANRQVNVVRRTPIQGKPDLAEQNAEEFSDLRKDKPIQIFGIVHESIGLGAYPSTVEGDDSPFDSVVFQTCGHLQQERTEISAQEHYFIDASGTTQAVGIDAKSLIVEGAERSFWFWISPVGVGTPSKRYSRISIDCERNTYRMLIDRIAADAEKWRAHTAESAIAPKSLQYPFRYPQSSQNGRAPLGVCDI